MNRASPSRFRTWQDALAHPLFKDAREEHVAPVLRETAPRLVPAGKILNTPGSASGSLHVVLEGRLQAFRLNPSGHQLLLEIIEAGGVDGILKLAGQPGHFTQALTDSVVVSLTPTQWQRLMEAEPHMAENLFLQLVARLEAREEQMESMAAHGAPALARLLLALARTVGSPNSSKVLLPPRLTHQMLADMLGVRRETVSMQLPELASAGAVEIHDGHYVLDRHALEGLADPDVPHARPPVDPASTR